jgi:RHS repeat-associated protein
VPNPSAARSSRRTRAERRCGRSATYLPFGGVHTYTGALASARFPGQWFQSESGLHQNWMRDYDPTIARYIQADTLGLVDGPSLYTYVLGNPFKYVDFTGTEEKGKQRRRTRPCNSEERAKCREMCREAGMESCKVSQTFRLVRYSSEGFGPGVYTWVDGPMSCSCNELGFCGRNPATCATVGVLAICALALTPWPDDVAIPGIAAATGITISD